MTHIMDKVGLSDESTTLPIQAAAFYHQPGFVDIPITGAEKPASCGKLGQEMEYYDNKSYVSAYHPRRSKAIRLG